MTGSSPLDAARLAKCERDLAAYQARTLAAELGWEVRPHSRAGRFEASSEDIALIGTAEEIRAWHREHRDSA